MRILLIVSDVYSIGGIQQYTRHLIEALELAPGVQLMTASLHRAWGEARGGRWRRPGNRPNMLAKLRFSVGVIARAIATRPDLIICNHLGLSPIARIAGVCSSKPYALIVYGTEIWRPISRSDKRGLAKAAQVVAISDFMRDWLIENRSVDPSIIYVLPCAVDVAKFSAAEVVSDSVTQSLSLNGKRLILSVGRLGAQERYKGQDKVIEALSLLKERLNNIVYVIVGEGEDRPRLEGLAGDFHVEDMVRFAGKVPHQTLVDLYNLCDVFIMPSRFQLGPGAKGEGFGIVYLEAAACAKPSIAGKDGPPADVVQDGVTGLLVDAKSSSEIADAIYRLLADDELRKAMGKNALEEVRGKYTLAHFRRRVFDIFVKPTMGAE